MGNEKFNYHRILFFVFLTSVFVLAIIKIEDTDTWMHLSLGRLIWTLKGLPQTEPFSYTGSSQPFLYSSWLFAVMYYLVYQALNVYGVILLMALTVTAAFFIFVQDAMRPYKNSIVSIVVMTVMVILMRHRFVERPDTFLMVFLSFSIFSLNAYVYDQKKYLYALPLVHLVWANCHSSINLMFVPFSAFIFGGLIQQYLSAKGYSFDKAPSRSQLKTIVLIFAASFAASLLNPNFLGQYAYGSSILSTPWFKQEIGELMTPSWNATKWPFLLAASVIISFLLNFRRFSFIHAMLMVPFLVLSFTAYRFISIFGIVAGPIMARNISSFFSSSTSWNRLFNKKIAVAAVVVWIVLCSALLEANVVGFLQAKGRKQFGFGINYGFIPEGALRYMDKKAINGRIFNPFHWGGYIEWRDFPKRSVFVDPRGVIPEKLLEQMKLAPNSATILEDLVKRYDIDALLFDYPVLPANIGTDIEPALSKLHWELVYWDDVSRLYLRRGGKYDDIVQQDEYKAMKPALPGKSVVSGIHDEHYGKMLIEELRRNAEETGSSKAFLYLSYAYNEIGSYEEAVKAAERVLEKNVNASYLEAYNCIALAYFRLGKIDESISYYKKALSLENDATTLYNLGVNYLRKNDTKTALKYYRAALDRNPNLLSAYSAIINVYKELGEQDKIETMARMYEKARMQNAGETHFKNGIAAYLKGELIQAESEYNKSLEANPGNPVVYSNLGYIYFDRNNLKLAYEYQRKALDIDPDYANAYYGLALVYKGLGDPASAKRCWQEYLRIEPAGYYSRKAAEQIKSIDEVR